MKKTVIYKGIIASILLSVVFHYNFLPNITKPFGMDFGDSFQVTLILKHNMDVIINGNLSDISTLPIFYGFKNSLFFSNHFLIQSILALPIYLVTKNIIFTFNFFAIITIILSFLSMYLLAFYLSRRILPSIIAGTVFVFNPFISGIFPDSLELFSLQWIPLTILFFEKSITSSSSKNVFMFFFFLTCQLLSSLYYAAFLTLLLPIYVFIRLRQAKLSLLSFFNRGFFIGCLLLGVTAAGLGTLYSMSYSQYEVRRDLEEISFFYSPYLLNWFVTPSSNFIYGGLSNNLRQMLPTFFSNGYKEILSLFWGMVPFIIFILSFWILPKSRYKQVWQASLIILGVSFFISLGPDIHITHNIRIPGPYALVHSIDPLFTFVRVPARISAFVFFFLALIIGLTLSEITRRLKPRKALFIFLSIVILIFLEYLNRPLQFLDIPQSTSTFYDSLKNKEHIKVVVDLPIGNRIPSVYSSARNETLDSHYMLWQLFHNKKLFNGYSSFLPEEYVKKTFILSLNFPTKEKLSLLAGWGVDGIILHKDEFKNDDDYKIMEKRLFLMGVPKVFSTERLTFFDITKWRLTQ